MRITDRILTRNIINDVQNSLSEIARIQRQVSTGKKIEKASQDPIVASKTLDIDKTLQELRQFQRNTDEAFGWMEVTLAHVGQVRDIIGDARVEALRTGTSTMDSVGRQASAQVIDTLRTRLLSIGNAKHKGDYIFGGHKTSTPPFSNTFQYQGDTGKITRLIGPGESSDVNYTGTEVFTTGVDLFQVLDTLKTAMENDDIDGIVATITNLDTALNNILEREAVLGSEAQRVESTKFRLQDTEIVFRELQTNNDDVDSIEAIIELQSIQNVYQAALSTSTQILQQTLNRFLR